MAAATIGLRRCSALPGKLLAPMGSAGASHLFSAFMWSRFTPSFDGGSGRGEDLPASPRFGGDRVHANFIEDVLDQTRGEFKHDIIHMLIMRNNSFVTVADSKGNKKTGASTGSLDTGKSSRHACDVTAERVARTAINLGPAVIKVKGTAMFKKKKETILSWKEGASYGDQSRILQIHDVTQLAYNGCRCRKPCRI